MIRSILFSRKTRVFLILLAGLLMVTGNVEGATYYSKDAGYANVLATWGINTDGTGTAPNNFTTNGDVFILRSSTNLTTSNNWTIGTGVTLQVDGTLSINGNNDQVNIYGTVVFTNSSATQVLLGGNGSGNDFMLNSGAILKTNNINGLQGTNCSLPANASKKTVTLNSGASYEFNGAAQSTLGLPRVVNNLILSGSGTKTLQTGTTSIGGNFTLSGNASTSAVVGLTIGGDFTIGSGNTFNGGSFTHTVSGNWTNNGGTFSPGAGTIIMNGVAKTIGGSAFTTFNNLTLGNGTSTTVNLGNSQTVNGTLNLNNVQLKLLNYNLTLGSSSPAVQGSFWTGNMIVADGTGQLRKVFTGTGSYLFPIGDVTSGEDYTPITLTFNSGTFGASAYAGVRVTDAKHPNNTSAYNYLTRYWTVNQSNISGFSCNVSASYIYSDDVVGQEGLQNAAEYSGSAWTAFSILGSNTLTATGVTTFGDFTGVGVPTVTSSVLSFTGFNYENGSGPSPSQNFTVYGVNLSEDVTVTAPKDYEISLSSISGYQASLTLSSSGGVVNYVTIFVRLKAGLTVGNYNSENLVISSPGATSKNVSLSGIVTGTSSTISAGTISPVSYCAGSSVSVPYTISGTFNSGNVFSAQLSDASGSFSSPVTIGTLTSISSGTISAIIPTGTSTGSGYRIRVVSNTPSVVGSDNGSSLMVNAMPTTAGTITGSSSVMQGQTGVAYSVPAIADATGYVWVYSGTGTTINGTGNSITIDFSGSATSGNLTVYGTNSCGNGVVSASYPVAINSFTSCAYNENTYSNTLFTPCINLGTNVETVTSSFSTHQYFLLNVIKGLNYQVYTCSTPAIALKMTIYEEGNPSGLPIASSFSNSGNTCSTNANNVYLSFVSPISGQVRVLINNLSDCTSTSVSGLTVNVNVSGGSNTEDDQNKAGVDSWVGHIYDGTNSAVAYGGNFSDYLGYYNASETFQEGFGTGGTWPANTNDDATCFNILSNGNIRAYVKDLTYSVRYRMNSTKRGLYRVDLTGDDGNRLTVDGSPVYSDWSDHSPRTTSNVLLSLSGSSSLLFDYYENGGQNVVGFNNLVQILSNTLSTNITQELCIGNSGATISGDSFGTLPAGISLVGTGYQWTYSTSTSGSRTNIPGATGATFTPNSSTPPFNSPGTYYVYRNAILSSGNNVTPNPYVATNESNSAIIAVTSASTTPSVQLEVSPGNSICEGVSVTFKATANNTGGGLVDYNFKINGESKQSGTLNTFITNTLANGNTITCEITVSGGLCLSTTMATSDGIIMSVAPLMTPSIVISSSETNVCQGTNVTFTATPTNGGSSPVYQWKVNGINVGTNASTYTYTPINNDVVTCVLISNATCETGSPATSNAVTMTVNPNLPVSVSIAASSNEVCAGTGITFIATPTNGGSSPVYKWKVNGSDAGTNNPTFTYIPANDDVITCELTSDLSCVASATATSNAIRMTIITSPTASAGSDVSTCASSPVNITAGASANNYSEIAWTSNGTGTFTDASSLTTCSYTPSAADIAAGSVLLTLTAKANGNCADVISTKVLTINPLPTISNVTGGGTFCSGSGVPVGLDNSEIGVNYQLYKDGTSTGSPVSGTSSAISFGSQTTAGIYTVKATNSATACTQDMAGSATLVIGDNEIPKIAKCLPEGTADCVKNLPLGLTTIQEFINAGGVVTDNCTDPNSLTVTYNDVILPGSACKVTRIYTITDESKNEATCTQTFTITDTKAPEINSVEYLRIAPDDGSCGATLKINAPTDVTEICSWVEAGAHYEYKIGGTTKQGDGAISDIFPEGTTLITWTVTDVCGHVSAPMIQTVQVGIKLTPISYDNGSTETGSGSGIQPIQTSTHEYFVDDKTSDEGYSYDWNLYEDNGTTTVTSCTITEVNNNPTHIKITFTGIQAGNYILSVIKTKNGMTCKNQSTRSVTVLENTFDTELIKHGDDCQAGETYTPSTILWVITFTEGGVAPYSLNYKVYLTDESNNQTVQCSGSVSNITLTGTTSSLSLSGCSDAQIMPYMRVEKTVTDSYKVLLKYTMSSITARNFKASIQINASDQFSVSEIKPGNNSETLQLHGVPDTSPITTD